MSRFLFFEKYVLKTKLPSRQICDSIADNIDPLDHLRLEFITPHTKIYEGEVFEGSFEIRKIGSYRTSLLVFAKATISELPSETRITIKIRPSISAMLFHGLWFGFVIFFAVFFTWISLTRDLASLPFLLIPLIMLFFASRAISYKHESQELKDFLATLLEGENN